MITYVHLLNDSSGSPRVLSDVIRAHHDLNFETQLMIGNSGAGVLDDVDIKRRLFFYKRCQNRVGTLFFYILSQLHLFLLVLLDPKISRRSIIWVNTLLPFGATIAGFLKGCHVICHLHEVSITPRLFQKFLITVADICSTQVLFVSEYHKRALSFQRCIQSVVPNCISQPIERSSSSEYGGRGSKDQFNVLMLASLRTYKGVDEFLDIARMLADHTHIRFDLVLNEDPYDVQKWVASVSPTCNTRVHSRTNDPSIFYKKADLVLNLSKVDLWVETFGLTIVEAMYFGLPVVCPPVGGPVELVEEGVHGFLISSENTQLICDKIVLLSRDTHLWDQMSEACSTRSLDFRFERFKERMIRVMD